MARFQKTSAALILSIGLTGCFESPESKIASHLNEDPAILEFGWKVTDVRHANDRYYAYIDMSPEFDAAARAPAQAERAARNLCPQGERQFGEGFWDDEDRFDSFRLVVSTSQGNVAARVDCPRDFDRIGHLTQ